MKIASANSWSAKGASRSSTGFHSFHKCLPCLASRWVGLSVLCSIMLLWFCWCSDWPRVKNLWLYNLKLEQAMRNLACGDLNCSYWGGLKLRKLVINDWVHVFPRVVSGDGVRVVGRWNDMYLFAGFLLGASNAENWGDHRKKNFFINSVELSMSDGLIETDKCIWVNTCLTGFSHKTAEIHFLCRQLFN